MEGAGARRAAARGACGECDCGPPGVRGGGAWSGASGGCTCGHGDYGPPEGDRDGDEGRVLVRVRVSVRVRVKVRLGIG